MSSPRPVLFGGWVLAAVCAVGAAAIAGRSRGRVPAAAADPAAIWHPCSAH